MSPNRPSTSTESTRHILGGIEESPQRDGDKLWRRRIRMQRNPLTSAEIDDLQSNLHVDGEMGYRSSAGPPKDGPRHYQSKFKRTKGSDRDFLLTNPRECQNPVQVVVTRNPAWSTSSNKISASWKTLDPGILNEIQDEPKSNPEDQVHASDTKDTGTDEWNTVYNPAVFFGVIPPGQESEPESDSEDFDKVYTSEADTDTDEEGLEMWVDVNDPGVFFGAASIESDGQDDGERPRPQPPAKNKDLENWLDYWPQAKELYIRLWA